MRSLIFLASLACAITIDCRSQGIPIIEWENSFGGSASEVAHDIQQTVNGYIVVGHTNSNDNDVSNNQGGEDYWILRVDSGGSILWEQSFGGTLSDRAKSVTLTNDGGFVVAGLVLSNDGNVSGHHGGSDFWIIKIDSVGALMWQSTLGGSGGDNAHSITSTSDGGFVVAGTTQSTNGDVTGFQGGTDIWVVKLDSSGALIWEKTFGGSSYDGAEFVQETTDGGFIIAGYSASNDGDITASIGGYDFWLVKIDGTGNLVWEKSFGGTAYERAIAVDENTDLGYCITGYTNSNDHDVSGNHGGPFDIWTILTDSVGNLIWQLALGGTDVERSVSVVQTNDGGYAIAGHTLSNDGDASGNHGSSDYWLVKLDPLGSINWQIQLGGSDGDGPQAMRQTDDGGFILAGFSASLDGDVSGSIGNGDFWVVKLGAPVHAGIALEHRPIYSLSPNPTSGLITIVGLEKTEGLLRITDVSGRELKRSFIDGEQLSFDLSDQPKGTYLIRIVNEPGSWTQKVIVE